MKKNYYALNIQMDRDRAKGISVEHHVASISQHFRDSYQGLSYTMQIVYARLGSLFYHLWVTQHKTKASHSDHHKMLV